jgi:hypothetical protein
MSRRITIIVLASAFVALSTYAQVIGERITLPHSDGVVIELGSSSQSWTPSRADVVRLEKALAAAVATNKYVRNTRIGTELANYKRQYFGAVHNGNRELRVTLFHKSSGPVRDGKWLKSFLQVMGGGDEFGHATFEPRAGRITELFPNGPK